MKILYIYRNKTIGFSIQKVFKPIEDAINNLENVESFYLPEAGASVSQVWRNIKAACAKVREQRYDVIHITGHDYYLAYFLHWNNRIVVTVHDLGFLKAAKNALHRLLLRLFWVTTLKFANKIICISDSTRKELMQFLALKEDKVLIIDNPVGVEFVPHVKNVNTAYPQILHIGTKKNKNLANTILAIHDLPCHLTIIGELSKDDLSMLEKYHIDYDNKKGLSDEELLDEYVSCDIVNFPSTYEGFGMPIVEGQAVGRVVVTSNMSPMKDVAGNGCQLVDPFDPLSIRAGYEKAIENYDAIVERGFENIKRFSLDNVISAYREVYDEIANGY